jgi:predicted RNA methylase
MVYHGCKFTKLTKLLRPSIAQAPLSAVLEDCQIGTKLFGYKSALVRVAVLAVWLSISTQIDLGSGIGILGIAALAQAAHNAILG